MDKGSHEIECPICFNKFSPIEITAHVDECLDKKENQDAAPASSEIHYESDFIPEKKLRMAAWGSLSTSPHSNDFGKKQNKIKNRISFKATSPQATSSPKGNVMNDFSRNVRIVNSYMESNDNYKVENKFHVSDELNKSFENNFPIASPTENSFFKRYSETRQVKVANNKRDEFIPLAEKMRPQALADYVGQDQVLKKQSTLRTLLETHKIPSMIFWGPPGCGKTSLAHIISNDSKHNKQSNFVKMSATTSGIAEVKEVMKQAKNDQVLLHRKTILFIDEIHRFNKLQQDAFLPYVENGTIVLIGATTENPSFSLNKALLSRCRVIVLEKLSSEDVEKILVNAIRKLNIEILEDGVALPSTKINGEQSQIFIEKNAVSVLANLCDGDARIALSGLQMAVESEKGKFITSTNNLNKSYNQAATSEWEHCEASSSCNDIIVINTVHIKEGLQRSHLLYDKKGDEHYNCISALHKSLRGSDSTASLYWLARMLEGGEDPLYIARRLIRFASEDVGLADPLALNQAVTTYQGCNFIGMPECEVILAQCVVYLARAPKSISIYSAYNKAKSCISNHEGPLPGVPLHLRNAPTKLMKTLGYGKDYKYNPSFKEPIKQNYLPQELQNLNFFT